VEAPAPAVIGTVLGLNEQVGGFVDPPVMAHDSVMVPVYPFAGVTVMVDAAELPPSTEAGVKAAAVTE
jgi:hypothetical protein